MAGSTDLDLKHARAVGTEAAQAAGALLRSGAQRAFAVWSKGSQGDLVTDLDLASEALIVSHLRTAFPEHRIITEEAGELVGSPSSWTWLVDPLDGTNNLAIGLAAYGVGLALCEEGLPRVGVVHDVTSATTWSAERGHGARGPAGSLRLKPAAGDHMTVAWIQGYDVSCDDRTARALTQRLECEFKRVLQLWAPLLCWVMLARGNIDGIVVYRSTSMDLQAGMLIAREAGVQVRELNGAPFDDRFFFIDEPRSLVAGSPAVVQRLLELVPDACRGETSSRARGGDAPGIPPHTSGPVPVGRRRPGRRPV